MQQQHGFHKFLAALSLVLVWGAGIAATPADQARQEIAARADAIQAKLLDWRRDIHAHPELGNAEVRTSGRVAEHLRSLKLEVRTGVARTGVIGVLKGGKPGPVVALRADMNALPVKEDSDLPFASKEKGRYQGKEVDVMHACGHDTHTAILMAVAEILASLRNRLPGTVVFLFQPAEEGPSDFLPDGTHTWGAKLMVQEGAMADPRPDAVFGLHVWSGLPSGRLAYRPGPVMAGSDELRIKVLGKQTHAALPWNGVDPITISAETILGLQTIISRQTDLSSTPAILSLGTLNGGVRHNIIPESVEMTGTIRSYDPDIRKGLHEKVRRTVEHIAESGGGQSEVRIIEIYDPTINDEALTERMLPTLRWAATGDVVKSPLATASEDFSFFAKEAPGLFFFLGVTPKGQDPAQAAPNHNPNFFVDESALKTGVRALAGLATDFLFDSPAAGRPKK